MSNQGSADSHVEVAIVTTSGRFPVEGFERVASNEPVGNELKKAVKELKIVDTTNFIARVGEREIDPNKSYVDNQLTGTVIIDYGPREGGGGNE